MVVVLVLFGGALLAPGGQLSAEEPRFRLRELNRSSTYSACAAIDVNGDQVLDVVCGGWWYEAPSWKRHFLRNVPRIRGRFDGYSCQPIDVNGDGWVDFVSANLRSRKLSWVEHPGPGGGLWVEHVVAYPGGMETGRLLDSRLGLTRVNCSATSTETVVAILSVQKGGSKDRATLGEDLGVGTPSLI